ncbi:MAG: hypothetical protein V2A78_07085 [bacterium]
MLIAPFGFFYPKTLVLGIIDCVQTCNETLGKKRPVLQWELKRLATGRPNCLI